MLILVNSRNTRTLSYSRVQSLKGELGGTGRDRELNQIIFCLKLSGTF